jgi:hypothetical protein
MLDCALCSECFGRHCVFSSRVPYSVGLDVPVGLWLGRKFRYLVLISDYDANSNDKLVLRWGSAIAKS